MKRIVTVILLIAVLVLAGCAPAEATAVRETLIPAAADTDKQSTMTVSAEGTVNVMPDVAYISVGVTTQNKNMQKAQSENKTVANALYDKLKGAGLEESAIRTTQYSVYPIYNYKDATNKITGYEVTNMAELKIKEIDRIGEYIDIAAQSGANLASSIRFDMLDEQVHYNEALALAMEAAKQKAAAIADAGGYTIVSIMEIAEISSAYEPMYRYADEAIEAESDQATSVLAGELSVTARLSVVFGIE